MNEKKKREKKDKWVKIKNRGRFDQKRASEEQRNAKRREDYFFPCSFFQRPKTETVCQSATGKNRKEKKRRGNGRDSKKNNTNRNKKRSSDEMGRTERDLVVVRAKTEERRGDLEKRVES